MHASHQGIGRERCGVLYVKMAGGKWHPLAWTAAMRPCATGLREMNYLRRFSTSTPSRARAASWVTPSRGRRLVTRADRIMV